MTAAASARRTLTRIGILLALALVGFLTGRLGHFLALEGSNVSLIWPESGVALAGLLLLGLDFWPGVWIGVLAHNLVNGSPLLVSGVIATGSTLEAFIAAYTLARLVDFSFSLERVQDVLYFIAFGVAAGPAISAILGVSALNAAGILRSDVYLRDLFTWWLGDAMGVLVITPVLLTWACYRPKLPPAHRVLEGLALIIPLIAVSLFIFSQQFQPSPLRPLAYLIFPFLVWAALRFSQRVVSALILMVSLIGVSETITQLDQVALPFVWNNLLLLWLYMATIAVTTLLMAATLLERRQMERIVLGLEQRFSKAFHAMPLAILITTDDGHCVDANEAYCAMSGYSLDEVIGHTTLELGMWPDPDERARVMAVLKEQGRLAQVAMRIRSKSGELRQVLTSFEIVELDGRPHLLGLLEDITERLKAEERLRESEQHYRELFEGVDDAVFVHDFDANILDVNVAACRRLGYTRDELLRMKVTELDTPDFAAGFRERLQRQISSGQLGEVEGQHRSKDGRVVDIDVNSKLITYQGQPAVLAVVRDITERKRTEARFRRLLEAAPDAMVIVDDEAKIVLVNVQAQRVFGYTVQELVGQPIELLIPARFEGNHLEHRRKYFGETRARAMGVGMELFALRKDGSEFPVEISLSPLETEEGVLVSAAIRDISERKLAEQKLRESEARYRAIVEDQTEMIIRVSPQWRLNFVNDAYCRYFGLTRAEVIGTEFRPNIYEEDRARVAATVRALSVENRVVTSEQRVLLSDGSLHWNQMTSRAILGLDGQIVEYQFVIKDTTESKEMEKARLNAALEHEKVKILTDFIVAASHDFRTPLAVINTSAYLLHRADDDALRSRHLRLIQEQTNYVEHLVEGLLTMSRLDRGGLFHFEPLDLNELIQQVEVQKQTPVELKSQTLTLELEPHLPLIEADNEWMFRALLRLVENAIQYTPPGGAITIRTFTQDGCVAVEVRDTGIGIDPAELPYVFDRLYRGEKHRPMGGQGLGLSIAKKIVEGHEGSLQVESEAEQGSVFRVLLPIRRSDTSAEFSPAP